MTVEDLINHDIPSLRNENTVSETLALMAEFSVTELPLVMSDKFVHLMSKTALSDEKPNENIGHLKEQSLTKMVVRVTAHPYEAATRMAEYQLSLLPVIDDQEHFLGVVTERDLFTYFFENSGLNYPGGIIVLTMKANDYSLSEIARICENSDTTILNVQLIAHPNSSMIDVILKTNKRDLQTLKSSFDRYEYTIKNIFGVLSAQEDLTERYRLLMHYINM